MTGARVLYSSHAAYLGHLTGPGHPERPDRLGAVAAGVAEAARDVEVRSIAPRAATCDELLRVHRAELVDAMEAFCRRGGGTVDEDTVAGPGSWEAALLAAGAGVDAVARLDAGEGDAAFVAVRPPGHHATPGRAMGFCLLNNVAVTATALADRGERVLVVDIDAHHGNGTQDHFYRDGRVAYVSTHEWPLYPGTGWFDERGEGDGEGTTCNVPLPSGATGDVVLGAVERVVEAVASWFGPTWLLVSAGFDAHRADPLTDLGLSAGDYHRIVTRLVDLVPAGRVLVMLEGGYDLGALQRCSAATVRALGRLAPGEGTREAEGPTRGGPGRDAVDRAAAGAASPA